MGEVLQYLFWAWRQQWDIHPALQNTLPGHQVSPFIKVHLIVIFVCPYSSWFIMTACMPSFCFSTSPPCLALKWQKWALVAPSNISVCLCCYIRNCTVAVQLFLFDYPARTPPFLLTSLPISLCWTHPWGLDSAVQNLALCHWNKIVVVCVKVVSAQRLFFFLYRKNLKSLSFEICAVS